MKKRPVSIALSRRILDKVDQEARTQGRSRSDWLERHLETIFFKPPEQETEIAIKTG